MGEELSLRGRPSQEMQTEEAFRQEVAALCEFDPALSRIVGEHGPPGFWHREPGFAALVLFILEQQVSLTSAAAAYRRLEHRVGTVEPDAVLGSTDEELREDGFSRQKTRYAQALAAGVLDGSIDLERLATAADAEVRAELTTVPGIGPWTADVYLLSCLRRPDIWPVGDRALQVSASEILGLPEVPTSERLAELGARWAPRRSTAARLLWHSYLARRR